MNAPANHGIAFAETVRTFARIGLLSFGGPVGQIGVMHRILVEEKRWIGEERFLHALNYCMLLPGPEAQQLACYTGWLLHRTWGGIVAGAFFVLPGFAAILALSLAYVWWREAPAVQALLYGLKPAIIALVVEALMRIGKRALRNRVLAAIAAVAFVLIAVVRVPFPALVAGAALVGLVGGRLAPRWFAPAAPRAPQPGVPPPLIPDDALAHERPSWARALRVAAAWTAAWLAPIAALAWLLGAEHILVEIGWFFAHAALVTFGGAYAVLAYIGQQAVEVRGWLQPAEMMDGLGMAETTPGPLIQVVQFVGFIARVAARAGIEPVTAAVLASVLVTWVTFVPSYLYVFVGAPWIERLRGAPALAAALSAITAAVVGVILNLALWFAVHTLFARVEAVAIGPLRLDLPVWSTIDWAALAIAAAACVATLRFHVGMLATLVGCVLVGGAWHLIAR